MAMLTMCSLQTDLPARSLTLSLTRRASSDALLLAPTARWALLPFRGFIREFAPLERSQRQQGASSRSVRASCASRSHSDASRRQFHGIPASNAADQAVAGARFHANPAPWPYLGGLRQPYPKRL